MKIIPRLVIPAILAFGCNTPAENKSPETDNKKVVIVDTTPRVTGIGGIFFFSDSPKATKEWYEKNLGMTTDQYGAVFETRNANRPEEANYLEWSPFKTGNSYFAPSKKEFMINYRVQNLEGLIRKLKANGVMICDSVQVVEYGKFVHIMDGDSTKIELWEPIDSVLTKAGGKTNK